MKHTLNHKASVSIPNKLGYGTRGKMGTKEQVQPIIDRIADQLPGWKANLMTKSNSNSSSISFCIGKI
jgi:hypothetical protein